MVFLCETAGHETLYVTIDKSSELTYTDKSMIENNPKRTDFRLDTVIIAEKLFQYVIDKQVL